MHDEAFLARNRAFCRGNWWRRLLMFKLVPGIIIPRRPRCG